ncbi:DUF7546 family protein [Halosimplex pelagicum]|uniref:Uncharacterized protein n=1 Tax=Halosimplex pelagicum TaxID=869886 RepID=A0A7D5P790_9EURY|nr:hypothetical protein [Halosimplex pelagicum]QLH82577.1 hypothetical protein HZS54_13540 [Halosimplex pelagicum]
MATVDTTAVAEKFRPDRGTLLWGALIVNTEVILLLAYAALGSADLLSARGLRLWVYPFVWINASIWAVARTDIAPSSTRQKRLAAALAVGYFGVLAYTGGLVGPGHGSLGLDVALTSLPPGWAPAVTYNGMGVSLVLIPYKLIGYATLAYLVYATVLDAAGSAVTGVLGLLSCVSCSWPVLASIATGVVGSGSGIAAAVSAGSYGISTVVFVATVALLVWRPFARE